MNTKETNVALIMFISIISANAQITWNVGSFTCTVPDTNILCNTDTLCTVTCTITNNSCCSSVKCNQAIDSILALPMGWHVTMCNPNGCFTSNTTQNTFTVPPSGTVTATFEIHAGNNTGNVNVKVKFSDAKNKHNILTFHIVGEAITGITSTEPSRPSLSQNVPNPFVNTTTIKYQLDQPRGRMIISDVLGRIVCEYALNTHSGDIVVNEPLPPGTYFYSLFSNNKLVAINKMIIQ